jgi:CRP-like cAMP-binding protein
LPVKVALPFRDAAPDRVREAAWVARCVGRRESAPLTHDDVDALAQHLSVRTLNRGEVLFAAGQPSSGVWIVRSGGVELTVGSGPRRVVVQLLRPGDVDGDLQLLLRMPMPYTARASQPATCLLLAADRFDAVLATHPALSRRWLTSIAGRLATSQRRLIGLLGMPLSAQLAQLLLDESVDGVVSLTQATLAAMLGVRRPSLNRLLRDWQTNGVVTLSYGRLTLTDQSGLQKLARG